MHQRPVRSIMTKDPISVTSDLPVDAALEIMKSNRVRRVPVVTKTGTVTGILTVFDAMLALKHDEDPFAAPFEVPDVKEAMTANVVTIEPDATIAEAARLMLTNKIGALPVVEDHKLVGLVTETHLFEFLVAQYGEAAETA